MPLEGSGGNTPDHVPRGDHGKWLPGKSANPKGRPPKMQACREAIDDERDPQKVSRMLGAFYERGIAGDNVAGKVWLDRVLGPVKEDDIDLTGAPPAVVEWFAGWAGRQ